MSDAEQRAERAAREIAKLQVMGIERGLELREHIIAAIILKHQSAWVSVRERLPELCCELQLAFVPPVIMGLAYRRDGSWFWPRTDEDEEAIGVTHWLPLPAAPRPAAPGGRIEMSEREVLFYSADSSPALSAKSGSYPASWRGKVPRRVLMAKTVTSDYPFDAAKIRANSDCEYEVYVNSHGALSAILPNGKLLGLKYSAERGAVTAARPQAGARQPTCNRPVMHSGVPTRCHCCLQWAVYAQQLIERVAQREAEHKEELARFAHEDEEEWELLLKRADTAERKLKDMVNHQQSSGDGFTLSQRTHSEQAGSVQTADKSVEYSPEQHPRPSRSERPAKGTPSGRTTKQRKNPPS